MTVSLTDLPVSLREARGVVDVVDEKGVLVARFEPVTPEGVRRVGPHTRAELEILRRQSPTGHTLMDVVRRLEREHGGGGE